MEQLNLHDALGTVQVRIHADARPTVLELRAAGLGLGEVARHLNAARVPTPSGLIGRWQRATVWRVENPAANAAYQREYRRRRWQ